MIKRNSVAEKEHQAKEAKDRELARKGAVCLVGWVIGDIITLAGVALGGSALFR